MKFLTTATIALAATLILAPPALAHAPDAPPLAYTANNRGLLLFCGAGCQAMFSDLIAGAIDRDDDDRDDDDRD